MHAILIPRSFRRVPQALVFSILFPLGLSAQTFYGIGELGTGTFSQVRDATWVSGNIVAVGAAMQSTGGNPAGDISVSWNLSSGLVALPDVVTSSAVSFETARVISQDGSVIGGSAHINETTGPRDPAVWTFNSDHMATVTPVGTSVGNTGVNGLSADGTVAYGFYTYAGTNNPFQAFRTVASGGSWSTPAPISLSGYDGSVPAAHGVSADGIVMVGNGYDAASSTGFGPGTRAFRYTSTGGTVTALSLLANGGTWSTALVMTPDGSKTIGVANSGDFLNGQLVSWDSAGAVTALGSPSSDPTFGFSNLGGVSPDGSVVVVSGSLGTDLFNHAYFYNAHGWFDFQTAMTLAGVNLTGWTLTDVLGMSADGTLVFGNGLYNGITEGWVLSLPSDYLSSVTSIPEPSTCALLMGAAGLGVVVWRRRKTAVRPPQV